MVIPGSGDLSPDKLAEVVAVQVLSPAYSSLAHRDCGHDPDGFDDLGHARFVLVAHDGHGGSCLPFGAATAYCGGLAEES